MRRSSNWLFEGWRYDSIDSRRNERMNNVERAVSSFKEGFSCSQALLSTYGPEPGVDRRTALRVSGAFGGGICRMGETCGAVTGALMVVGLKYGRTMAEDEEAGAMLSHRKGICRCVQGT